MKNSELEMNSLKFIIIYAHIIHHTPYTCVYILDGSELYEIFGISTALRYIYTIIYDQRLIRSFFLDRALFFFFLACNIIILGEKVAPSKDRIAVVPNSVSDVIIHS